MSGRQQPSGLSPDLRARVLEQIARTPAPTRREHRSFLAGIAGVTVLLVALTFVPMGGLVRGARPDAMIAFSTACAFVVAAVLTRISVGGSGSMLGPPSRRLALATAVSAPLWVLLTLVAAAYWPGPASEPTRVEGHVLCAALMIVQGGIPLAAFMVAKRRSDPIHPMLTGASVGACAGAWAMMMAYVRCPHADVVHGVMAHVIPTLLLAAAGAFVGRALLGFR